MYARRCRERNENVVVMLSPEIIGYYTDEKGRQKRPGYKTKEVKINLNLAASEVYLYRTSHVILFHTIINRL